MTSYERDTSIVYNDAEDTAVLCTFSPVVIRRMDKLVSKTTDIVVRKQTDNYAEYVFPKKMVKVSIPQITTAIKLADALGVTLDELVGRKVK